MVYFQRNFSSMVTLIFVKHAGSGRRCSFLPFCVRKTHLSISLPTLERRWRKSLCCLDSLTSQKTEECLEFLGFRFSALSNSFGKIQLAGLG